MSTATLARETGHWTHAKTGRRIGSQRPRVEHVPAFEWTAADDAAYIMQVAGKPLDDWQQYVLQGAMGEREDGRWTAFEVGLIVPRQNGKNVCIEARELAGLFILGDRVTVHSAHQFKTARKSFRDMERLIRYTPELFSKVLGWQEGMSPLAQIKGIRDNGSELSIEVDHGFDDDGRRVTSKLEYQARSSGGGRGFTGDLIVLDEAYDLDMDEIAAMLPTMAARSMDGNPQIWYTSSAGMPKSHALADLRDRGMNGKSPRLAYYEWSAPDDAESDDLDAWYVANPGLNVRIGEDYIRETELEAMDDEKFRRERMGIWARIGGEAFIPTGSWARRRDTDLSERAHRGERIAPNLSRLRLAIDVAPDRSRASIGLAGIRPDGTIYVELIDRGEGLDWVVDAVAPIWERRCTDPLLIAGSSTAADLVRDLRRAGVSVRLLSQEQYGSSCGRLLDAVRQGTIAHLGQKPLDEAVEAALPSHGGARLFTWKRTSMSEDITPLVAVTVAASPLWASAGEPVEDSIEVRRGRRTRALRPRTLSSRGGARGTGPDG